ncbi:DNA-binding protein [Chromobacterium vaccinii]|uniref:DNA-binding protein n=1 Tax=Chromobacterium vaccinii TaxID=1108595 RepID=UPI003C754B4B
MTKKLYSASEIAHMGLKGLPTSRDNIRARAESEGWYREEQTGRGGVKWVYEIPSRYIGNAAPLERPPEESSIAGTIVAGSSAIDLQKLQMVETVLEEALRARGLVIDPERRGAVVAFLYDYAMKGGNQEGILMAIKALVA